MVEYTVQERVNLVLLYAECSYNYQSFGRKVRETNGSRLPRKSLVDIWLKKLRDTGSVENAPKVRRNTVRTAENIELVQNRVEEHDGKVSIRNMSNEFGMSYSAIQKILKKDLKLYPYKAQTVQELYSNDYPKRQNFALQMMGIRVEDPNFEHNLFFVDEAHFHLDGVPNKQNFRIWAEENPQFVIQEPLHSDRITALMGIGYYGVIGPFFFDGNVNGERYREMLEENVIPALSQWPNYKELVFIQDGAPAHWAKLTRALLDRYFPNRWIGRDAGFISWPPRSPDLSIVDFFVWGYLKSRLYKGNRFRNIEVLKERIIEESQSITVEMSRRSLSNFWDRLLICEMAGGMSVEIRD